jgi:MATE family multidrug resistance protein
MVIGILSNILNVILNFVLVTGIGYQGFGFVGAPIATSLSRWGSLIMMAIVMYYRSGKNDQPIKIRETIKDAIKWTGMKEYMKLAVPSALMLGLEVWGFEFSTISTSFMGSIATSAHAVVLNYIALTFMIPLSIATASGVRVGQRLGGNDPVGAKQTCWLSVLMAMSYMFVNGIVLFSAKSVLGHLFTDDPDVMLAVEKITPIAALFQLFDGAQVAAGGVLRGMGKQTMGAVMIFIAYYVIGLPLGCFFAFYVVWGLSGLWLGLLAGLGAAAIFMNGYVALRVDWKLEAELAIKRVGKQDFKVETVEDVELHDKGADNII